MLGLIFNCYYSLTAHKHFLFAEPLKRGIQATFSQGQHSSCYDQDQTKSLIYFLNFLLVEIVKLCYF